MAGFGNDWNELMQSKLVRILLNGICVVVTAFYAIGGVVELVSPRDANTLALIEQLGTTGYYALTIARIVVCLWVSFAFMRMIIRTIKE